MSLNWSFYMSLNWSFYVSLNWSFYMSLNLTPLTTNTGLGPQVYISGHELQNKTPGNMSPRGSFTRMRNFVDGLKNCSYHWFWDSRTDNTSRHDHRRIWNRIRGQAQSSWRRIVEGFEPQNRTVGEVMFQNMKFLEI